MMARCSAWLDDLNAKYAGKVVVAFGHGTFQNGVETLLLSRGEGVEPRVVFTRKHGESHLKRGFPHDVHTAP